MRENIDKSIQEVFRFDGSLTDKKIFEDLAYALDQSAIVAITDRTGKILYVNDQFVSISQYDRNELIGATHRIINSDYHSRRFFKDMWKVIGNGNVWRGEIRNKRKDGTHYWVDTTIVPFLNNDNKPYQYISIRYDVTRRVESARMIRNLAYNDQLTDLPNRMSFRKMMYQEIEKAEQKCLKIGYVRLNIDRLRHINDSLGFEAGDFVLSEVAKRLKTSLPSSSVIGRLSGDEFGLMLTDVEGRDEVEQITKQLVKQLEEPLSVMGELHNMSYSFGIALYPEHAKKPSELGMKAEKALEMMKEHGGGGYEFYQPGTATKTLERILLENELRKSVKLGQLHLDYQPKMELCTGKITGIEALVRWNHPDLGKIPPVKFIPVAEETKIIIPLGEWVLREACKQINRWIEQGYEPVRVSVNLSPVQLREPAIVQMIRTVLEETGTPPHLVEVEMTESAFLDREAVDEKIQAIRDLGITIAIDDFGTGYSAFSYIKELPADVLKIDMSFVRDIEKDEDSKAIVQAILSLAETVGLEVVAEGVETEKQSEILQSLGCGQGQGYLFSKPASPEACKSFLRKREDNIE